MHEYELTREERELLESPATGSKRGRASDHGARDVANLADFGGEPLDLPRQLEVIETFHQDVAERFADALSRALQRLIEVQLVDVQAMNYSQYAFGRARPTCYFVLQATPLPTSLAMELNPSFLYPILDALLGGGKQACPLPQRGPTELEQRLARRVVRLMLDELHDAWEPLLAVDLSIDRVECDAQRVRMVAPAEDVIVLTFEARLNEQDGRFSLCLPQRAIQKIVDKLLVGEFTGAEGASLQSSAASSDSFELTAHFEAEPILPVELDNLREGDVILTGLDMDGAVDVSIDGQLTYHARPGVLRGRQAIVIDSPVTKESA